MAGKPEHVQKDKRGTVDMINGIDRTSFKNNTVTVFKQGATLKQELPSYDYTSNIYPTQTVPIYEENPIVTKPSQLSLFQIHDFHGQSIKMERAFSIINNFDNDTIYKNNNFFDKNQPIDKIKLASGDIFLGEKEKDLAVANEFLNLSGIEATALGNHECDMAMSEMTNIVKNRKYKFLGANMHPDKNSPVNQILSSSYIKEVNGNRYGIIGLVPPDMANHLKYPETINEFHISDIEQTKKDLQHEVDELKKQGINKIIVISHVGYRNDKFLAENVTDVDVMLSAHTHNYLGDVKKGENLLTSPKGEPVLITQVGRDGEYVALPNIKFNELGQITDVQYNIVKTDNFSRNLIARNLFEKILGKPETLGFVEKVEDPPKDIYAYENPHCNFILDSLKSETNADIAIMNSANIRGRFYEGKIDTRDLSLASPFGNKVAIVRVREDELVDRIEKRIKLSMSSKTHRPGILQVSGLRYKYSMKDAKLLELSFIDKDGHETPIDIKHPRNDKFYKLASDDFCITSPDSGMNLSHRFEEAIQKFETDKDVFVGEYLKKHNEPITIKKDGRIQVVDND